MVTALDDRGLSINLYHEVLEAATVGAQSPPESVIDFNEGDFERVAQEMHQIRRSDADYLGQHVAIARFSWIMPMLNLDQIQIESTKLANGERVLRLTQLASGYVLEKKLDRQRSVVQQKQQLLRMFEAALASLQKTSA